VRLALVCNEYPPAPHGGIGTFVRTYAQGLAAAGHDVTVVGAADADDERQDGPVRVVGVARTRVRGFSWLRDRLALRRRLVALDRASPLDLVEAPDYEGLLPFGLPDVPVVLRLHGSAAWCAGFGARRPPAPVRWCERETARKSPAWIHPSRHVFEGTVRTLGVEPADAALVPHPVPAAPDGAEGPPAGLPPGRVVLFVGSLWEFRGVLSAARAARVFLPRVPDARIVFVGQACAIGGRPAPDAVRVELGPALADRVSFTGRVPEAEVARWMRASSVFLYPSPHEAFGLVYLEAMREGLPVVGSARGTGPEIVEDGVTGLLADPDDADALAAHVEHLLADDVAADRMAAAARARLAERFSVERCVAESVRFCERAVAGALGAC
jgi:glycosyltransferase involved in cell wall biosynthesis